ncbi:MAG: DUF2848 domain-containing protein [Salinarimonas sp.]|nr:DUF2848 domain-containing protein [Salinarimonas sp.]
MQFETGDAGTKAITIDSLVVAGWTARDRAAVDHHIEELAALGVPAPSQVPLFYRLSASLLTQESDVEFLGAEASGEVEPLLVQDGETLWLGLGSDHTDRKLETVSVAFSKQACAKPVARQLWRFDELRERLDDLALTSWIRDRDDAEWQLYQQGTLAAIRPLAELMAASPFARGEALAPGTAMMCGTFGAKGGVRPAGQFRMELRDPVQGRSIEHVYRAKALPVIA